MNLPAAEAFVAVVDLGSLRKAAERLGTSSATVSRRLSELEAELGVRLVERTTRSLRVTDLGLAFHARCANGLASIEEAHDLVAARQERVAGAVRISTAPTLGPLLLGALAAVRAAHPEVHVLLVETERRLDVHHDDVDLFVRVGAVSDERLVARRLGGYPHVLVASKEYVARGRSSTRKSADSSMALSPPPLTQREESGRSSRERRFCWRQPQPAHALKIGMQDGPRRDRLNARFGTMAPGLRPGRTAACPPKARPIPLERWTVDDPIEALEARVSARWDAIRLARGKTTALRATLRDALVGLDDPNCSVVVTGSLGRGEASEGSDADWVLLVDGPSDPGHSRMAREISDRIRAVGLKDVGPTGTFGNIVVSHELVHYIAGTRDTNENLTRRILLLAESRALTNPVVRERVIRNVLARYVLHDPSVQSKTGRHNAIPHFLLNDVVRYWRTMTSDYASKMWERTRKEWGIRNIKLRFSRKLLFVWGLLASFAGELFESEALREAKGQEEFLTLLSDLIREQTEVTPLELLARVAFHETVEKDTARSIFDAYDEFLRALADPEVRARLESVEFKDALTDPHYDRLRGLSGQFRFGLTALFFDQHPKLKELIRKYGVF